MRRKAKVDDNQQEIVRLLRQLGCSVKSLAAVGGGCPDLLVALSGKVLLIEVKDGAKPPSRRQTTDDQKTFHAQFPVHIVETDQDAINLIEKTRRVETNHENV